jgi:hypothetical protein
MRLLRSVHLWLGCLFAPTLLLFALSGGFQILGLHENRKAEGYKAPEWIKVLSSIHLSQELSDDSEGKPVLLRQFFAAAAAGLIMTTLLGLWMSIRMSKNMWLPILLVALGFLIPISLLLYYQY